MNHHLRGGLTIALDGAPAQTISPAAEIGSVAVFGADYPDLRPDLLVEQGDRVEAGTPLFRDRKRHDIRVTSPVSGHVARIEIGARRRLSVLELIRDGDAARGFEIPEAPDRAALAALLQEAGLWPAFRARPFGRIPEPDASPAAIFVTAIETEPLAADAPTVLDHARHDFEAGVQALAGLTEGPVFVCQGPGGDAVPARDRIRVEKFHGPHPAGLPGTHVDRLWPATGAAPVWQIHYQDAIAIGHLLREGRLSGSRVVALGGPEAERPRLVRVPDGASLDELLAGEMKPGPKTVLSGSPLTGRESSHLRRRHWQVSVLHRVPPPAPPRRRWWAAAHLPERPHAVVPTAALERALGVAIPVVPLVRALSASDVETAEKLGAARLLEEDLALVSYAAGNGQDFGRLLRQALDALEEPA